MPSKAPPENQRSNEDEPSLNSDDIQAFITSLPGSSTQIAVMHRQQATMKNFPQLSCAEQETLSLLLAGYRPLAIAELRSVAKKTVDAQIYALYRKLGIRSRQELLRCFSSNP